MTNTTLVAKKYLLIDLDGTLVDTVKGSLKSMKDGKVDTDLLQIKPFEEALKFLEEARNLGFDCVVLSDSHPSYVNPVVKNLFGGLNALSLSDKPNTSKTLEFLRGLGINHLESTCYVIGDSWLDIELGRGLQVPTILTEFYEAEVLEVRDGIGDYRNNIKSGPTYYVKSYSQILNILRNPLQNLLLLEAEFLDVKNSVARAPRILKPTKDGNMTLHRVLARQAQGECDRYHVTEKYFEFSRVNRSEQLLHSIRDAIVTYIDCVLSYPSVSWDIFTYVPDKGTTQPPDKMGKLFNLITDEIQQKSYSLNCLNLFDWKDNVSSSTRKQSTAEDRRMFVGINLSLQSEVDVKGKNVIILDDQYTTGATAETLTKQLRAQGAQHVLFIALFHLVTNVSSNRLCPDCSKPLRLKINRTTGEKFYSCPLPTHKGNGCGYSDSGKLCPECFAKEIIIYMKVRRNSKTGNKFYSCVPPKFKGKGCGHTENYDANNF